MTAPKYSNSFHDQLKTAMDIIADALATHEIFNTLRTPANRRKYAEAFMQYHHFFNKANPAVFITLIICLYKIGETRKDTVNLPRLIKDALKEKLINAGEYKSLETQITATKKTWIKVCTLRKELFGHTNDSLTMAQVFSKAAVTPKELETLAQEYANILNELALKAKIKSLDHATYSIPTAEATEQMLIKLSS